MPWHPRTLQNADRAANKLVNLLEVHDPRIIVVLPGEEGLGEVRGVCIGERMGVRVPATEAEIEATNAGAVVVDDDYFLVMGPEFDVIWWKERKSGELWDWEEDRV